MKFWRNLAVVMLVFATVGLAGCKKVQTTFVNGTSNPLELQVNGPGKGVGYLGTIPPDGQLRTTVAVSPVWLPTTYTYIAKHHGGIYSGAFSIAWDSNPKIWIMVPHDKKTDDPDWRHAEGASHTGKRTPVTYQP